ncbi:hypothetical protein PR048_009403 [Dryococelus australis]|uniref:Uncharacterized protein n=1 Tax=Dryococelus australis TaxID=614101 RepID=A0ABQ9I1M1_9NEOP|nr:hypothetical protein PR048_009403 [Dryococelus australis]
MFVPLKLYFQSQEKCPNVIKIHFGNPLFEAWLWFIHSQASTFHDSVKLIEEQLSKFKLSLKSRIDDSYLPLSVKSMLLKLEQEGYIPKEETSLEYLEKWSTPFEDLQTHGWVMLKTTPTWENIEKTEEFINNSSLS